MANMKELFIVRHAKSSWDIENISDIDRSLKLRGIRDAYEMARRLKIARQVPDFFLSSQADRAMHTATIFIRIFELPFSRLSLDERLYGASVSDILEAISDQDNSVNKLMIFGHNPDFSELTRGFAKSGAYELPTCGLVIFTFNCQKWNEISRDVQIDEFYDFPKKGI